MQLSFSIINALLIINMSIYCSAYTQIRGIRNLIFYSLPERKDFYLEVSVILILYIRNFLFWIILMEFTFGLYMHIYGSLQASLFLSFQMVHMLEGSNDMTSTALFSCFDLPRVK